MKTDPQYGSSSGFRRLAKRDAPRTRPNVHTVVAIAIVAATAAVVAATQQVGDRAGGPAAPQQPPATTATSATTATLSLTDIAFIELMISMNESALPLLDLLASDAHRSTLADAAATLSNTYRAELPRLRAAQSAGGAVEQGLHDGHDMPGFVTDAQLAAVRARVGSELDTVAREMLCGHLNQSLLVTNGELRAGSDPATRAVATQMVAPRTDQLAALGCDQTAAG